MDFRKDFPQIGGGSVSETIITKPNEDELRIYLGKKVKANVRHYSYHTHFTPINGIIIELKCGTIGIRANEFYSGNSIQSITV